MVKYMNNINKTAKIMKKLNNVENNLTIDSKEIRRLIEVIRIESGVKLKEKEK